MKVLFAIRDNSDIVDSLVRKYNRDNNKNMLYKMAKNFTAITKEVQENNDYDRIVISDDFDEKVNKSEDREAILLKKLKGLLSVAKRKNGKNIPIIFICKNNKIAKDLMDLKVNDFILKKDAGKKNIYELMNNPRSVSQAKAYYKSVIGDVVKNETEKKKEEKKIVANNIANKESSNKKEEKRYPLDEKLAKCAKYLNKDGMAESNYVSKFEAACEFFGKQEMIALVSNLKPSTKQILAANSSKYKKYAPKDEIISKAAPSDDEVTEKKRGRGRPRKNPVADENQIAEVAAPVSEVKRGRGRPRKNPVENEIKESIENKIENQSEEEQKTNDIVVKKDKSEKKSKKSEESVKSQANKIKKNKQEDIEIEEEKNDDKDDFELEKGKEIIVEPIDEDDNFEIEVPDEEEDFETIVFDDNEEKDAEDSSEEELDDFEFDTDQSNDESDDDFDFDEEDEEENKSNEDELEDDFEFDMDESDNESDDFDFDDEEENQGNEDELEDDFEFDADESDNESDDDFDFDFDDEAEEENQGNEDELEDDFEFDMDESDDESDEDFDFDEEDEEENQGNDDESDDDIDFSDEDIDDIDDDDFDFDEEDEEENQSNEDESDDDFDFDIDEGNEESDDDFDFDDEDEEENQVEENESDDDIDDDDFDFDDEDLDNLDDDEIDALIAEEDDDSEEDDDLNLISEDESDEVEDDDIIDFDDEDDEDDILSSNNNKSTSKGLEDLDDDNFVDLDEDDSDDEDDDILNLDDENDADDTDEDSDDFVFDDDDDETDENDIMNLDENEDETIEEDDDDFSFDDDEDDENDVNDILEDESDNETDESDILDLDDETDENEDTAEDDDILNLDDEDEYTADDDSDDDFIFDVDDENDDIKIDDKPMNNTTPPTTFSGIANKNYNPNYDISKQLSEINGNDDESNNSETSGEMIKLEDMGMVNIGANQRVVSFVGARNSGTSFLVNNIALLLSEQGVKVAVVDLTKNKNSYYIYTENEENLRNIAYSSFEKLKSGIADGIKVNKCLTVYTALPNSDTDIEDKENSITTLLNNYSLVLFDCDFDTDLEFFNMAQDIYFVQSFDILTIQALTSFIKKLKMNKVEFENKMKIIVNKFVNLGSVNERSIVAAMSVYNSPDTTYQLDLFDRSNVEYYVVPFEEKNYCKYLEEVVKCKLTIRGYSKALLNSINKIAKSVYPLNGKKGKNK